MTFSAKFVAELRQLDWARGLRAGLAVAVAMIICRALGLPLGWSALGAFEGNIVDNGGPYRTRFASIAMLMCAGSLGAVLASRASNHLGWTLLNEKEEYLTEGRFGPTVWERLTQGLGTNPAWPFAGVDEIFDCKEFMPQGFQPGTGDDNGHCIWFDYVLKHHIAIETAGDKVLGGSYETAMREAFFKIAARYSAEVLKTFVYYKPQRIVTSMSRSMRFNFGGDQSRARHPAGPPVVPYPPLAIGLLFVSLAVALVHFGIGAVSTAELSRIAGVTFLLAAFTLPTYFAVWATPPVSADLLLHCLFGLGLAAGAILVGARSVLQLYIHGVRVPAAEKIR